MKELLEICEDAIIDVYIKMNEFNLIIKDKTVRSISQTGTME
jgi:hypothetical protein